MKRIGQWFVRTLGKAMVLILTIILLPYVSKLASAVLPDLSGAAMNTSILLSHKMENSARLETTVIEDEGILQSSTDAMFLGTVQSVTVQYQYKASVGIDLSKVQMKVRGKTITLLLPPLEILSDSLTPMHLEKNDFFYPLTEERRQKLLDDELLACRERCLAEYLASPEAWTNTVAAMENTVGSWMASVSSGVTVRIEQAQTK